MKTWTGLLLAGLLALAPLPARAASGCEVIATGHPDMRGNCRYFATTTTGTYTVATSSGFLISIFNPDTKKWRIAVWGVGVRNDPASSIKVEQGEFPVAVGEMVDLAIAVAEQDLPADRVWRYQDGIIKGGDAPS